MSFKHILIGPIALMIFLFLVNGASMLAGIDEPGQLSPVFLFFMLMGAIAISAAGIDVVWGWGEAEEGTKG